MKPMGYCWVKDQQRPYYSSREIRRGKLKGWFEIQYLAGLSEAGAKIYRRAKIKSTHFRHIEEFN